MSAAAPALTPLLSACGGPPRRPTLPRGVPRTLGEVRQQLREVVAELAPKHAQVSALVTSSSRGGAAIDAQERGANRSKSAALVLVVSDGTNRFEQATTDLRPVGIERALRELESRASPSSGAAANFGAARDHQTRCEIDPTSLTPQQWLERVDALHQRAARVGGSRVVYRGSYLTVDDTETLFISKDRDLRQRIVRTRGGVLLVAWTGSAPTVDDASRSGTIGLEALDVGSDELERAAERALSLITARPAPSGTRDVVVDPTITALIAHECLGSIFAGDRWQRPPVGAQRQLGSELITLVDDPSMVGGFGSYFFDDEGQTATRTVLVESGQLRGTISDLASATAMGKGSSGNGRRRSPLHGVAPRLSNIAFATGATPRAELMASVDSGLLVEGALAARADPRTHRFAVRASRAREIHAGKLTGALYDTIDLHGDVYELLAAVRAVSAESGRYPARDDGVPISRGGPFMVSRTEVSRG